MKPFIAAFALALALVSPARAQERIGDAALGALSGGLVFGPVGLVAGAVVGYAAGPAIKNSWRSNRPQPRPNAKTVKRRAHVAANQAKARKPAPAAGEVAPAPGVGGPPAQGLE